MIKMTCCFCGEKMKMENGVEHSCETTYSPAKTLTDEEIIAIADDPYLCNKDGSLRSCIDFARAILRKAQEK